MSGTTQWIALLGGLLILSADASQHLRTRVQGGRSRSNSTSNSTDSYWGIPESDDIPKDAPFTIIFVADVENKYRGHETFRSKYVVNYIRDLKEKRITFDGNYSNVFIDPKLVIHGGDISHMWSCDNNDWFVFGGCRDPDDEYKDIWDALYDTGIPMISSFGNHDWRAVNGTGNPWGSLSNETRDEETDYINTWSSEFVRMSYKKSELLGVGNFRYEEVKPMGKFGPSMFWAEFAGLQIANFNAAWHWQSYDDNGVYSSEDQFTRFSKTLERRMKTLFFSHYPLNSYTLTRPEKPTLEDVKSLIREFGVHTHHFSGHIHVQQIREYNDAEPNFNDYVAPYPHTWNGNEPGFYAILVSPLTGILQVKVINIPGLEVGQRCIPLGYLNPRSYFWGFTPEKDGLSYAERTQAISEVHEHDTSIDRTAEHLDRDLGCESCKSGKQTWSRERHCFICQE